MAENVLIVHGGGPTAVINSSLYGVIEEAKKIGKIDKVYAAIGGSEGILKARFLNLLEFPEEKLKLLLETPATAIGSSRYALEFPEAASVSPPGIPEDLKNAPSISLRFPQSLHKPYQLFRFSSLPLLLRKGKN